MIGKCSRCPAVPLIGEFFTLLLAYPVITHTHYM